MKFFSTLILVGSGVSALTKERVLREKVVHHCDFASASVSGVSCNERRRRLRNGAAPDSVDLASYASMVPSSDEGFKVSLEDWTPGIIHPEEEEEDWTVYVNFGGEMVEQLLDDGDLFDELEVVVKHDLGETVKDVDVSKLGNGVEDVAVGNFKFETQSPEVIVRPKGGADEASIAQRRLTISHVAYRKLRRLGVTFDWQSSNSGCKSSVGDQGGCGDCYAWTAAGIYNERTCRTGSNGLSVRQLACEAKDFMNSPGNGGCEGGWVDKNLDYMRSNGVCKKRDVDWPWYCIGNDCLECDGNWYGASKAMYPSCNRNKLTTGGDWRSLQLPTNDAGITALKNYLQNEGTFGYNFEVNNDFMFMGSNLGGWFGGDCDGELPYKGGADSCCRKKKKKSCSWWGSCSDRSSECDGTKGGHAVRITGWGNTNGEEYWKMQNSWGTGWAQDGYMEISTKKARWGWSTVDVDQAVFRRVLAEVPEFGLDYLHDEESYVGRFLDDSETLESWKPGFNVDMEISDTVVELAQSAMDRNNCTIVPSNMEGFEDEMRDPSVLCLQGITMSLVEDVILSSGFMAELKKWARPFTSYDGPPHELYIDLAKELGEMLYDAASSTDIVGEEIKALDKFFEPLGIAVREIVEAKMQTVNGYIWKLKLKVYPLTSTSEANDFDISLEGWTKGDFTEIGFNVKMIDETANSFLMDTKEDKGSNKGLHMARIDMDETLEETKVGGGGSAPPSLAQTGGIIAVVGLVGIMVGFFVKHKLAESRVAKLQTQVETLERASKGGSGML